MVKNSPANAGNLRDGGSIPESGRSRWRGHGHPLQYSCLENPLDRGAGRLHTVHRVMKSRTWLSDWTCTSPTYPAIPQNHGICEYYPAERSAGVGYGYVNYAWGFEHREIGSTWIIKADLMTLAFRSWEISPAKVTDEWGKKVVEQWIKKEKSEISNMKRIHCTSD